MSDPNAIVSGSGAVGGNGGNPFWELGVGRGAVVQQMRVYKDDDNSTLIGVDFTYSDGSTGSCGHQTHISGLLTLAVAERITELTLWGNGVGTRCGRVYMKTSSGQEFDFGSDNGQNPFPLNVSSGILAGAYGRAGDQMDQLGFLFIKPIQSIAINIPESAWVDNPAKTGNGIAQVTVKASETFENNNSKPTTWSFDGRVSESNTSTFSQSAATVFGVTVSVTANLFDIAEVETGFEWSQENTTTQEISTKVEISVGATVGGTLDPGAEASASTIVQLGTLANIGYDATVTITTTDRYSFQYSESGVFSNVVYAYGKTVVKDGPAEPASRAAAEFQVHL